MIPMIGFDVSYSRKAFRAKINLEGFSSSSMLFYSVLEGAAKSVQAKSDNRWIITNKAKFIPPFDKEAPVELMAIVPAGNDQYEQFLAATALFEEFIAERLGAPVDTTLRTLEGEEAKCANCDMHAIWVRIPQFGSKQHFCDLHAQQEPDFDDSDLLGYPQWERLHPINIY